MKSNEDKGWSPYLAGALSGLLVIISVWVSGNYFGSSTSFVRLAGKIEEVFSPAHVAGLDYFSRFVPQIDWQWMFVVGIVIGSFVSAITSGSFRLQAVPDMWEERFGGSWSKRGIVAFSGGVISLFGARIAGG